MDTVRICSAETMTKESVERCGVVGIAEPGDVVTIWRVRPDGAASWDTFIFFVNTWRGCWSNGGMDFWGDTDFVDEKWRLRLDDTPVPVGGTWYIDPELGRFVNEKDGADAGYSLDPKTAIREAEEAGACWAESLERGDYSRDEFARIVANANDPEFPDFPYEELFDAAFDAAYEAAYYEAAYEAVTEAED